MAYYSSYRIEIEPNQKIPSCDCQDKPQGAIFCPMCGKKIGLIDVIKLVQEECEQRSGETIWSSDKAVWYNHELHLCTISHRAEYLNILFKLYIKGSEDGDYRIKYFKGGRVAEYAGTLTYPEFNERDLRDMQELK